MRPVSLAFFIASLVGFASAAGAAEPPVGLPSDRFVLTWVALPTGHFVPNTPPAGHALAPDALDPALLAAAFAAPQDPQERRDIAINEMAASWEQPQKTALEQVRETRRAFVAAGPATAGSATASDGDERFASLLSRVGSGTGLSVGFSQTGEDDQTLAAAYDASAKSLDPAARAKADGAQQAWLAYRAAFAALADLRAPGRGDAVKAELTHRRIADLQASTAK